jgi:hypothetical protein
MANTKKNEVAVRDFDRAIAKLMKRKPTNRDEVYRWMHRNTELNVNQESIRLALKGGVTDPTACALELLVLLQAYFNIDDLDALGTFAGERLRNVLALVGGPDGGGGQRFGDYGWLSRTAHLALVSNG